MRSAVGHSGSSDWPRLLGVLVVFGGLGVAGLVGGVRVLRRSTRFEVEV